MPPRGKAGFSQSLGGTKPAIQALTAVAFPITPTVGGGSCSEKRMSAVSY